MTRRRMFAFSRIRKLQQAHVDRQSFNNKMAAVIDHVVNKSIDAQTNGQVTNTSSGDSSDSAGQAISEDSSVGRSEHCELKSGEDKEDLARTQTDMSLPVISESPELNLTA